MLEYLSGLPTGKVTPWLLAKEVNSIILPSLDIVPKKPISIRTSWQWLIKLGWHCTLIKKGVYMDDHEWADVVEYWNDVFLPKMAHFEARMVYYEGPELRREEPHLGEGELEIILLFHDECCFHAFDQVNRAW